MCFFFTTGKEMATAGKKDMSFTDFFGSLSDGRGSYTGTPFMDEYSRKRYIF